MDIKCTLIKLKSGEQPLPEQVPIHGTTPSLPSIGKGFILPFIDVNNKPSYVSTSSVKTIKLTTEGILFTTLNSTYLLTSRNISQTNTVLT